MRLTLSQLIYIIPSKWYNLRLKYITRDVDFICFNSTVRNTLLLIFFATKFDKTKYSNNFGLLCQQSTFTQYQNGCEILLSFEKNLAYVSKFNEMQNVGKKSLQIIFNLVSFSKFAFHHFHHHYHQFICLAKKWILYEIQTEPTHRFKLNEYGAKNLQMFSFAFIKFIQPAHVIIMEVLVDFVGLVLTHSRNSVHTQYTYILFFSYK